MPKKSWASDKQQNWLLAQLANFFQAQESKTTPTFFITLYQKFHEQWPLAFPNTDEISQGMEMRKRLNLLSRKLVSI